MYQVGGGGPRMRKVCRAHTRRKVVVQDDAVMVSTIYTGRGPDFFQTAAKIRRENRTTCACTMYIPSQTANLRRMKNKIRTQALKLFSLMTKNIPVYLFHKIKKNIRHANVILVVQFYFSQESKSNK
jgi:hypothetical protein